MDYEIFKDISILVKIFWNSQISYPHSKFAEGLWPLLSSQRRTWRVMGRPVKFKGIPSAKMKIWLWVKTLVPGR